MTVGESRLKVLWADGSKPWACLRPDGKLWAPIEPHDIMPCLAARKSRSRKICSFGEPIKSSGFSPPSTGFGVCFQISSQIRYNLFHQGFQINRFIGILNLMGRRRGAGVLIHLL